MTSEESSTPSSDLTITEHELTECERVNATGRQPVVFVHGLCDAAADLRRTYTAMQRLTHQDRQVLELVAVDGLSAVEAARALSISPVAARVPD